MVRNVWQSSGCRRLKAGSTRAVVRKAKAVVSRTRRANKARDLRHDSPNECPVSLACLAQHPVSATAVACAVDAEDECSCSPLAQATPQRLSKSVLDDNVAAIPDEGRQKLAPHSRQTSGRVRSLPGLPLPLEHCDDAHVGRAPEAVEAAGSPCRLPLLRSSATSLSTVLLLAAH